MKDDWGEDAPGQNWHGDVAEEVFMWVEEPRAELSPEVLARLSPVDVDSITG